MKKILSAFLMGFIMVASGCAPGLYEYHKTSVIENPHYQIFPLYIDKKFSKDMKIKIGGAINETNFMLNGQMRLEVKEWSFDEESDKGKEIEKEVQKTHQGLIIFALTQDDERIKDQVEGNGTLAFVNGIGNANLMVVITDRIGNRNLKTIVEHELCHFLGAQHVNSESIMYPYANEPEQINCIDKITVSQIAHYHHLNMQHLNWCKTNDFD